MVGKKENTESFFLFFFKLSFFFIHNTKEEEKGTDIFLSFSFMEPLFFFSPPSSHRVVDRNGCEEVSQ